MFFLTALRVAYVLDPALPEIPPPSEGDTDEIRLQCTKHKENNVHVSFSLMYISPKENKVHISFSV